MQIELYIAVMAGVVLWLFVMVSEVVFLRKRFVRMRKRLIHFYLERQLVRLAFSLFGIAAFFLVQPLIIAYLVMMSLDSVDPVFSSSVFRQIGQLLPFSG
jgi:site-specific recombinase